MKNSYLKTRAALVLLMALFCTVGTRADVVTVGETTATYGHMLPIGALSGYALTQQVYTAEEINHAAGNIWSVGFNTVRGDQSRHLSIYMATTTATGTDSYVPPTTADLYFSGDMYFTAGQWNTIEFDKPFAYDGTSNVLITICDDTGLGGSYTGLTNKIYDPRSTQTIYASNNEQAYNPTAANTETDFTTISSWKAQIQLDITDYPTPGGFTVTGIGNTSVQAQCSLRGSATAWNLRYRQVAKEGEQEQRWTTQNDLTTRSFTIEGLTAATPYEAQAQAVFGEDHTSDWTPSASFTTACCPLETQSDIRYELWGDNRVWKGYAVQLVDVTEESNPVEVAYLAPPTNDKFEGTLTLCNEHVYQVNWIYDEENPDFNHYYSLKLSYEMGDLIYSMATGDAPEEDAELTTFVLDAGDYCAPKPKNVEVATTTHNTATLTFTSETTSGEVVYGTTADFDLETATPTAVTFEATGIVDDPWGGTPPNASLTLTGLESLTDYYVSVRSVCEGDEPGFSRWSDPVKVRTGSLYDSPTQVTAEAVNSQSEKLSWGARGTEKQYNAYYRKQAKGTPVNASDVNTMGGGNGKGFQDWDGIWVSYGDRPFSNTLYVMGGENSQFSFGAANGKSGSPKNVPILYGSRKLTEFTPLKQMKKLDRECLNDADRQARIKELEDEILSKEQAKEGAKKILDDGQCTQEEYDEAIKSLDKKIAEDQEELAALKALPTDDKKLERMKELEKNIQKAQDTFESGTLDTESEAYKELLSQYVANQVELNELRALTSEAASGSGPKNGFTIGNNRISPKRARAHRTPSEEEEDIYVFFIRHANDDGMLWVKDLTITSADQVNEWTCIPNIEGTEYTLTGLEPGTAYEVMVEPVYDDGNTGTPSPITVFTTIGEETDPVEGEFSVGAEKKVQFAHGNLRFSGDIYEGTWSVAKQQYEVLGDANVDRVGAVSSTRPADLKDLLCWSSTESHYGVSNYYYYDDESAAKYFQGDFVDWGTNPALISFLGGGWSTLSKDEWNYLLNERENAAQLKALAAITYAEGEESVEVKGLVIAPDNWTESLAVNPQLPNFNTSVLQSLNLEQWALMEAAGAVFLPVTGHLWSYKDEERNNQTTINGMDVIGNYWTSTSSTEEPDRNAFVLRFNTNDSEVTTDADTERRLGCAVRLVKEVAKIVTDKTALNESLTTATEYYDGIKTDYADIAATLKQAIDAAQAVADNKKATQDEVDAAKLVLDEALAQVKADVEIASSIVDVKTAQKRGVRYNLGGQRVGKAYKGIVIVDGAKTVRK